MIKRELLRMLQGRSSDGDLRLDLNKTTLFITTLAGILLTTYAVIVQASFAEVFFITMMSAGAGTTITKGIVDTVQKRKERE